MASFTKKAIRETFLKLLREKPVSRISICEIVETCGINRNTFYYYYQDLPELIEEILIEETEKAVSQFNDINSIEECVELLEGEIMKNKKPILHLHQSSVSYFMSDISGKSVNILFHHSSKTFLQNQNSARKINIP